MNAAIESTFAFTELTRTTPAQDIDAFVALYEATFPEIDEREDPSEWLGRVRRKPRQPQPITHVILAKHIETGDLAGGVILEYYRKSCCGLITYLLVDGNYRKRGLGRQLVRQAVNVLQRDAANAGQALLAVFAECENPADFVSTSGPMPPWERIMLFSALGARWLRFPYVQPALGENSERVTHLLLLALPIDGEVPEAPPNAVVLNFLHEFYRGLGIREPKKDADYLAMQHALKIPLMLHDPVDVLSQETTPEAPCLTINKCSVCLHFWESVGDDEDCADNDRYHYCPDVGSMELDLLSHTFRNPPVCNSANISFTHFDVEIHFPERYIYRTEGRVIEKIAKRPVVPARLGISRTRFCQSGRVVWHIAFMPTEPGYFTEYDIIKLIHLYDGRSEQTGLADKIGFRYGAESKLLNVAQLIARVLGGTQGEVKAGTVQIITAEESADSTAVDTLALLRMMESAREKDNGTAVHDQLLQLMREDQAARNLLTAYCGIVTGIFDFVEVDDEEILDTFEPTFSDSYAFIRIHRGTVISISESDRAFETFWHRMGANPYLFLPHAVLIHNEEVMRDAEHEIETALTRLNSHGSGIFRRLFGKSQRPGINDLERALHIAERNLSHILPNVFNYYTEQVLFSEGMEGRGLVQRLEAVKSKLHDLKNNIDSIWQVRRETGQMFIAILLALISVAQLKDMFADNFLVDKPELKVAAFIATNVILAGIISWLWLRGIRLRRFFGRSPARD